MLKCHGDPKQRGPYGECTDTGETQAKEARSRFLKRDQLHATTPVAHTAMLLRRTQGGKTCRRPFSAANPVLLTLPYGLDPACTLAHMPARARIATQLHDGPNPRARTDPSSPLLPPPLTTAATPQNTFFCVSRPGTWPLASPARRPLAPPLRRALPPTHTESSRTAVGVPTAHDRGAHCAPPIRAHAPYARPTPLPTLHPSSFARLTARERPIRGPRATHTRGPRRT